MDRVRERLRAFRERHGRAWVVVLVILCSTFVVDRWAEIDFAVNHRSGIANAAARVGNFLLSNWFLVPAFLAVTMVVLYLSTRPIPPVTTGPAPVPAETPPLNPDPEPPISTNDTEPLEAEVQPLPLIRSTPYELWGRFGNLTDMQAQRLIDPLLGRPMQISGSVRSVGAWNGGFSLVSLETENEGQYSIYMLFRDESWVPHLEDLKAGDQISVRGELERVTRTNIQLNNCAIVEPEG